MKPVNCFQGRGLNIAYHQGVFFSDMRKIFGIKNYLMLILCLGHFSNMSIAQEIYRPEIKERTVQQFTIETDDGPVLMEVKRVRGALVYGDDMIIKPDGVSEAIGTRRFLRWNEGIIPYRIASNHPYRNQILEAIATLNSSTVLWYVEATSNHRKYISIIHGSGCYSGVGEPFWGNSYEVSIGDGCQGKGIIIHELLHAAGLFHEHQRFDRDNYVRILWRNIKRDKEDNFKIPSKFIAKDIGAYNYASIMHYSCDAFSKNREKTIESRIPIGQRNGLSKGDVDAIAAMYYNISSTRNKPSYPPQNLPNLVYPSFCTPPTPNKPSVNCGELRQRLSTIQGLLNNRLEINTRKALLKEMGKIKSQIEKNCR